MAAKSPDAFRTISEVADWLDRPAHVLRFWESKFPQVKPVKRAGGRRYYRPDDMLLLGGIKKLLHDDGMTIKGVQKLLREQGVRHVCEMSQPLDDVMGDAMAASDVLDAAAIDAPDTVAAATPPHVTPVPPTPQAEDSPATVAATPPTASPIQLVPTATANLSAAPASAETPPAAPVDQDSTTADAPQPPIAPAADAPPPTTPAVAPPVATPAAMDAPPILPIPPEAPAPVDAPAPLGADLPPPPDLDAIRIEPGLLALIAGRRRPIAAADRDALTPILARIDALTTRLVATRKG